jgi:hypothetical protein
VFPFVELQSLTPILCTCNALLCTCMARTCTLLFLGGEGLLDGKAGRADSWFFLFSIFYWTARPARPHRTRRGVYAFLFVCMHLRMNVCTMIMARLRL